MKLLSALILLLLLISFFISDVFSSPQQYSKDSRYTNEASQLWQLIHYTHQNLQRSIQKGTDLQYAVMVLTQDCELNNPGNSLADALAAESYQRKSNRGFKIRGGYTSKNISDDVGDPNSFLEISWDVWRQGYFENKHRANSLQNKSQIAKIQAQFEQLKLNDRCRRYQLSQTFSGQLSYLLTLKLQLMEPVYLIEKRAYFKAWNYLDDLLVSEQDIRLLRQELKYLNSDPFKISNKSNLKKNNLNLPIIDVNLDRIISLIREDDSLEEISKLEKNLITEKNSYSNKDIFRLFLRREFETGNNNDKGVVAGFRFSVPIEKNHEQSFKHRISYVEQKLILQSWERITRTRAAYQSFLEQIQRVIKQQYRLIRAQERIRRTLVEKKLDVEIQLAAAVTRLRSYLDATIEQIRAKEELYRRVNEIFLVSGIELTPDLIRLDSFQEKNYRARSGERSMYLWSKGFNRYRNTQIFDFIEAKGIQRVLLTAGRAVDREKMHQFIKHAKEISLTVESIIGPNKLFFKEHHKSAAINVEAAIPLSDAVHLDIEPHTFPDYKKNKVQYLKQYIDMLRTIRQQSPQAKLTVAVPFHWLASDYEKIGRLVDRVYIMAYGSTKATTIRRRILPVLQTIPIEKIVITLRVTDFTDEWAMENMISSLQKMTGIQKYSFHTFRHFLKQAGAE